MMSTMEREEELKKLEDYREESRRELAREIAERLRGGMVLARYNPEAALKDQSYLADWIEREYVLEIEKGKTRPCTNLE